jgi:hypothetical protein
MGPNESPISELEPLIGMAITVVGALGGVAIAAWMMPDERNEIQNDSEPGIGFRRLGTQPPPKVCRA